ncbi:MAG TPA: ATP-binding protein, partial [Nitrososphaera sp.]|nr:ATP-binding protein [Nitrososphaera sp.]
KFTQRGHIRIQSKAMHDENKIEIRIIDNGSGIPDEMMSLLFQKFATKGHGNVVNHKGSGLGLYISRAIINDHNGEISAFNNNNNEGGATFAITLPISPISPHKK